MILEMFSWKLNCIKTLIVDDFGNVLLKTELHKDINVDDFGNILLKTELHKDINCG